MTQTTLPFDITVKRHKNSPTSVEANLKVDKAVWREKVLQYAGSVRNFTLKDLCRHYKRLPNELSGRVSELKALELIEEVLMKSGKAVRRDGCAVLRLVKE